MIDMVARRASSSRRIAAPANEIFDLLADPSKHALFDGSDMVNSPTASAPERLALGSKFNMSMTFKIVPYRIGNTVVEFEENRLIAWQHMGKHRWRYELEPVDGDSGQETLVTETFDWSTAAVPKAIELAGYPKVNLANIERTLERLAKVVESS